MNGNLSSLSHNGLPIKSIVTNVKSALKNARLVKPILVTCGLMIFQRFTGKSDKCHVRVSVTLTQTFFLRRSKLVWFLCCEDFPADVLWDESSWRVS